MQSTFSSGGHNIRLQTFEPTASAGPHPAILLLHGAGGNAGFWLDRVAPLLTTRGIAVYAVHYFDRTGTGFASPALLADGVHVPLWIETVADALRHIASRPRVDAERIALIGISLGAFLALALGTQTPGTIRAIVEISGGLAPPYDSAATSAFPPTLILHGDRDTVVPVHFAHELQATFTRLHVAHGLQVLAGEGHWFSPTAGIQLLGAVTGFLADHL